MSIFTSSSLHFFRSSLIAKHCGIINQQFRFQPSRHISTIESQRKEAEKLSDAALQFLLAKMKAPPAPDSSDPGSPSCCGSGCSVCVWDTYSEDADEFIQSRNVLREELIPRLTARGETYDASIESPASPKANMDPALKALIDMEKKMFSPPDPTEAPALRTTVSIPTEN